jgi:hypothetical protein
MEIQFVNNWIFKKDELKQFNVLPDISFAFENDIFHHVMLLWAGFVLTVYRSSK